jgi:hypothetical protein
MHDTSSALCTCLRHTMIQGPYTSRSELAARTRASSTCERQASVAHRLRLREPRDPQYPAGSFSFVCEITTVGDAARPNLRKFLCSARALCAATSLEIWLLVDAGAHPRKVVVAGQLEVSGPTSVMCAGVRHFQRRHVGNGGARRPAEACRLVHG